MMIIAILQVNSGIIVAISDEVTKHINSDIHIVQWSQVRENDTNNIESTV